MKDPEKKSRPSRRHRASKTAEQATPETSNAAAQQAAAGEALTTTPAKTKKELVWNLCVLLQEMANGVGFIERLDLSGEYESATSRKTLKWIKRSWPPIVENAKALSRAIHWNMDRWCGDGLPLAGARDHINEALRIVLGIATRGEEVLQAWRDIDDLAKGVIQARRKRTGRVNWNPVKEALYAADTFSDYLRRQQCEVNLEKVMDHLQAYSVWRFAGPAGGTGEAEGWPSDTKPMVIDLSQWKKGGCRNLMQDLIEDDLRSGVTITRRHGKYQPRELRRTLRETHQLPAVADAIKPVKGKSRTFRLTIPRDRIARTLPKT